MASNSTSPFSSNMKSEVNKYVTQAAESAGKTGAGILADSLSAGMVTGVSRAGPQITSEAKKTGEQAGQESGDSLGEKLSKGFTTRLGAGLASAASTITGYLGSIGSAALQGGITQVLGVEDASAKLSTLGLSTQQVASVMADTRSAMAGTFQSVEAGAAVAASAIAAGVEPGAALTRHLGLAADAAAFAGGSMSDMGSILASASTSTTLYSSTLDQLSGKGVPALQWLADEYGVTQDAMKDMVAAGQVDSETFMRVMEQNIGGAAEQAAGTTGGSFTAMKNGLSDLAAGFLSGPMSQAPVLFGGLTDAMATLSPQFTALGDVIAEKAAPMVETLVEKIKELAEKVDFSSLTGGLSSASGMMLPLGGIAAGLVGSFTGGLPQIGKLFTALGGPMTLVLAALAAMVAASPELRAALGDTLAALGDVLVGLVPVFQPLLGAVADLAGVLGGVLAEVLTSAIVPMLQTLATDVLPGLMPVFVALGDAIGVLGQSLGDSLTAVLPIVADALMQVMAAVAPLVPVLAEALAPVIATLAEALAPVLPLLADLVAAVLPPLISAVMAVVEAVLPIIPLFAELIGTLLPPLAEMFGLLVEAVAPFVPVIAELVAALLPPLVEIFMAVWSAVEPLIPMVLGLVEAFVPLLAPIAELVGALLAPLAELLLALLPPVTEVIGLVVGLVAAIMPAVTWLGEKLVGAISSLMNWLSQCMISVATFVTDGIGKITEFARGVGDKFGEVIDWFTSLPGEIGAIFSDAGQWLVDAGRNIIDGFWNGLKNAFENVKSWVGGIGSWIADHKGPRAYDLALLVPAGGWIMDGLRSGLEAEIPALRATLARVTDEISIGTTISARTATAGAGDSSTVSPARVEQTFQIYEATSAEATARAVARRQVGLAA